jgi:L-alanine-DL-glutamate epimerase-like enolase superfamily enzyme
VSEIVAIDITHHQLPLDPPFPASWDPTPRTRFPVTIVRVTDSAGRVGVGSGDVMHGFADHAKWFLGQDALDLGRHAARLANIEFHAGRPWPLDIALWDLAGKVHGEPVWRMLAARSGRATARLRLYASTAVHRSPSASAEVALRMRDLGFGALKLRFGRPSIDDDLRVLDAVRDAIGDTMEVMVDCNQGWRMPWDTAPPWRVEQAWSVAERLIDAGVYWMEEPLHRGDRAGMAELRRRCAGRLLIAGAEMTREPYELRDLLHDGCLDVFQPDCVCTGGISGLSQFGAEVVAAGHTFTPHTWGNGIGVLANLHLAAGVAGAEGSKWVEWPLDPPEWTLDRRDYPLAAPLVADDGCTTLPDEPGLGLVLDEDRLLATASDRATFS